jgi:hypothetical protein
VVSQEIKNETDTFLELGGVVARRKQKNLQLCNFWQTESRARVNLLNFLSLFGGIFGHDFWAVDEMIRHLSTVHLPIYIGVVYS